MLFEASRCTAHPPLLHVIKGEHRTASTRTTRRSWAGPATTLLPWCTPACHAAMPRIMGPLCACQQIVGPTQICQRLPWRHHPALRLPQGVLIRVACIGPGLVVPLGWGMGPLCACQRPPGRRHRPALHLRQERDSCQVPHARPDIVCALPVAAAAAAAITTAPIVVPIAATTAAPIAAVAAAATAAW